VTFTAQGRILWEMSAQLGQVEDADVLFTRNVQEFEHKLVLLFKPVLFYREFVQGSPFHLLKLQVLSVFEPEGH
jgi:hypothetical protein